MALNQAVPADDLGPLVHLWGVNASQLPPTSDTPEKLAPFLCNILREALPFIDSAAPKSGAPASRWKPRGSKTLSGSAAKVDIAERVVPAPELREVAKQHPTPPIALTPNKIGPETWICRRSVHADTAAPGTAAWSEFQACIRDAHAETETAFTPTVVGHHDALVWYCGDVKDSPDGDTWGAFTLRVEEMKHRIPPPLNPRVFAVLQMTCSTAPKPGASGSAHPPEEFLVVSIPVIDFAAAPAASLSKEKGVVIGRYASIERVRRLPNGDIEWIMATASDAKGVLPMWVQTRAVPGQIAKDVPLFLTWLKGQRKGRDVPAATDANGAGTAGDTPAAVAPAGGAAAADGETQGQAPSQGA